MFALMAWLQLAISVLLAAAIIWGYTTYQASFGQVAQSVAASIKAVSDVVVRTAETVESSGILLDQSGQMLSEKGKTHQRTASGRREPSKDCPSICRGRAPCIGPHE